MNLIRLAPVLLGLGVFSLFALGEYFRSWTYFRSLHAGPYLQFAAERFLGYYTTAINNAAVVYYYEPLYPLRYTLGSLFEFPILGTFVNRIYEMVLGRAVDDDLLESRSYLLETYANDEFNNVPIVGLLVNEYSVFLAPVAAFLLGVLSVSLYRSFVEGRMVGALLYPSWFVGVLEISRHYYWAHAKYFPTLGFLAITLIAFVLVRVFAKLAPGRRLPVGRRPIGRNTEA